MQIRTILFALTALIFPTNEKHTAPLPAQVPAKIKHIEADTTQAILGIENLKVWNAWKKNPVSRYDWLLIGDSYTQGNFYSGLLRDKLLAEGYKDGGPGYCSFGRWSPTEAYSIDGSINAGQLTATYNTKQWESINENTYGPCNHVKNTAPKATISVTAKVPLNTLTLIYERHSAAGNFRYRVNKGTWKKISASNPKQDIASLTINTAALGKNINVEVESLAAGQIFCGMLGKRTGNVLTLHKAGSSGARADVFAQNPLWEASTRLTTPKGVTIMFGTNEENGNIPPETMKANVQNIIDKVRRMAPKCDILIMSPVQTTYDNEQPRKYKLAQYAEMLRNLAVANKAAFIDHAKVFGPFGQASVDNEMMATDRVHPGPKGGEVIAETIYKALKK